MPACSNTQRCLRPRAQGTSDKTVFGAKPDSCSGRGQSCGTKHRSTLHGSSDCAELVGKHADQWATLGILEL